jgi:hypothetical protein
VDFALFEALLPRLRNADTAPLAEIADVLRQNPALAGLVAGQEVHHGLRRQAPTVSYTNYLPAL